MGNQIRKYGLDAQLTVVNATTPVVLVDQILPSPSQAVDQITAMVNCDYVAGPNDSFKNHAVVGSYIEIYIEIYTPSEAAWKRITPSSGEYRLRTTDDLDVLVIDHVAAITGRFRLMAVLELAPTDTIELDWTILFDVNDTNAGVI